MLVGIDLSESFRVIHLPIGYCEMIHMTLNDEWRPVRIRPPVSFEATKAPAGYNGYFESLCSS